MNRLRYCKLISYLIAALIVASCSTTRVIPHGESRLKANKIIIENSKDYQASELQPYLKQKPNTSYIFGWNPFLNIYNWSNGNNRGWDKFVTKVGQAPVIFDSTLVQSSKTNIYNHLVYDGYYNSKIQDSVVTKNKKSTVYYKVKLGKQYVIDSISYSIADKKIAELFFSDTSSSLLRSGDILSENNLEKESQRVENQLRNNGFYGFSKNYFFFEADTLGANSKASLNVKISDYTRNELAKDAQPHKQFVFGDVYINPSRASMRIADTVQRSSRGFTLDTCFYKGAYITYYRRPLLRRSVLSRINKIRKGDLYNQEAVANTYRRFSNIGVFSSVNVQLEEMDSSVVQTDINLTASALQGYKVNLEASTNSSGLFGVSPTVSYYHKNIFRGGELFALSFMGDFQFMLNSDVRSTEFGVSSSLSIPNFLLLPDRLFNANLMPKTEVAVSYNYQQRPEYTRNIISASYGYSWSSKNNRLFYKVNPIQLNVVKLMNLSKSFYESLKDPFLKNSYQDHFDFGLGANLYYTTDASANPQKSYFYFRWQNNVAGNLLSMFNNALKSNEAGEKTIWGSPYSQYYRGEVSAVYTWKFGKTNRQALAARVLVGAGTGYGNSVQLPFEQLFWAGGAYSLRAWQARSVGPGYAPQDTTFAIPNQTGDVRLEANIEYRFPLFWSFDGAVFFDAGNVWNLRGDVKESVFKFNTFYRHLAADWGLGLRLNLGFALLRVDWGLKIYDPPTDMWMGPQQWFKKGNYGLQFGVGYPF